MISSPVYPTDVSMNMVVNVVKWRAMMRRLSGGLVSRLSLKYKEMDLEQ